MASCPHLCVKVVYSFDLMNQASFPILLVFFKLSTSSGGQLARKLAAFILFHARLALFCLSVPIIAELKLHFVLGHLSVEF
ncbi:hypothetical protein DM860_008800 [Cuscuta australis]|uniref:Uncharacterized protein n=1 Tax=Cuscuta australis TaxID=267555 RepID=A0A328D5G7_9ASTE|nr:hypothetical protein DM860_008800 [Cuscuta australis]